MQKRKDLTNEDYNAAVFQEGHLQKVFWTGGKKKHVTEKKQKFRDEKNCSCDSGLRIDIRGTVSYTHLDVYKRQEI